MDRPLTEGGLEHKIARQRRLVPIWAVILGLMASPGQTYGVSVFIDPMIADLGVSRSLLSTLYTAATLGGAALLPLVGGAVDQRGLRAVAAGVAAGLAAALALLSQARGPAALLVGFLGIRLMGQGGLTLLANNALAVWFRERRGAVMGATLAASALLIAAWPPGIALLIESAGWRGAWGALAAAVAAVLGGVVAFGLRDPPERARGGGAAAIAGAEQDWTLAQARRTGAYWVLTLSGAVLAATITALGFHQISILGERGLDPVAAAANFTPQFLAVAAATWAAGRLLDRAEPLRLVALSSGALAAAALLLQVIEPGWSAAVYAITLGAAAGTSRALSGVAYPRWFGTAHLGSIQGAAGRWMVAGSALGPLPLALARDTLGSYEIALLGAAAPPALFALAALLVGPPGRRPG
jgi:MFS family permease